MRYVLLIAAIMLALAPTTALAFQPLAGVDVVIDPNLTINDDLYVFNRSIDVRGTVNGDVVAFAKTIIISGVVTGDVIAVGNSISIPGHVGGSVRGIGASMSVDGSCDKDVVFVGGSFALGPSGSIGRDLAMAGYSVTTEGAVGGKVFLGALSIDVRGKVGSSNYGPSTNRFSGENAANAAFNALTSEQSIAGILKSIPGSGSYSQASEAPPLDRVFGIVQGWLQSLAGLLVLGAVFVLIFPRISRRIPGSIRNAPWTSLGVGLAAVILIPTAALVLFVAGLFLGIWWLGLVLMAIYLIVLPLSFTLASLSLGNYILERAGRAEAHILWGLLAGLAIALLVSRLPFLGIIFVVIALLFGLGAMILAVFRSSQITDATLPSA